MDHGARSKNTATYIYWIFHSFTDGQSDWEGDYAIVIEDRQQEGTNTSENMHIIKQTRRQTSLEQQHTFNGVQA